MDIGQVVALQSQVQASSLLTRSEALAQLLAP